MSSSSADENIAPNGTVVDSSSSSNSNHHSGKDEEYETPAPTHHDSLKRKALELSHNNDETTSTFPPIAKRTLDSNEVLEEEGNMVDEEEEEAVMESEVLDLAKVLGYQPGQRLQVQWEISDVVDGVEATKIHWWGATLLDFDGRTEDNVAIRVLDYDPYPEGGFPDRSKEDVIFLGKETLVNPSTLDELNYRPEGDGSDTVWLRREDIETVVNATLESALNKNAVAWGRMSSAKQAMIASAVAEKKEKLLELLLDHPNGQVITSDEMKNMFAKIMTS